MPGPSASVGSLLAVVAVLCSSLLGRVLYSQERLVQIGQEAAKTQSPFSIEDRIGLVDDAFALSKAGYSNVSSALALADVLRNESEC